MDYYDILLAKKLNGGGGSSVEVEPLSVTENGTYEEEGKAFSPVTVNVSGGSSITPLVEITVINNSSTDAELYQGIFVRDNKYYNESPIVASGETKVLTAVAKIVDYGEFVIADVGLLPSPDNVTITSLVNCTVEDDTYVLVTDFNSNASLTLTVGDNS